MVFYGCSKLSEGVEPSHVKEPSHVQFDQDLLQGKPGLFGANQDNQTVSVPFKANFTSKAADDTFREECGDGIINPNNQWVINHHVGEGNATHLGRFSYDYTTCFHRAFKIVDGRRRPDLDNGHGTGQNGEGTMIGANGDQIFFEIPEEHVIFIGGPKYRGEYNREFFIVGGTGRFEGAAGHGVAITKIPVGINGAEHSWNATLILPK